MLHSTDPFAATGDWYVLSGLAALGGICGFTVALGCSMARARPGAGTSGTATA
jgi:hypothetical protein